jgi:hypothetical protein
LHETDFLLQKTDFLLQIGVNCQLKAGCLKMPVISGKPSSNLKFSHRFVTTADAKIPLSVVRVKRQPQDVVFCAPYAAPSSAIGRFCLCKTKKAASWGAVGVETSANSHQRVARRWPKIQRPSHPLSLFRSLSGNKAQ